jgi:geranylgeranyl pyrophosphate synthase
MTRCLIDDYFSKALAVLSDISIEEGKKKFLLELAGQMVNRET